MTCVSTYKDAETCYQEKNYDKENKEKITKNRNMVRSDALHTELRRDLSACRTEF